MAHPVSLGELAHVYSLFTWTVTLQAIERGQGGACNILVTQPRRISAVGMATRVAQERAERVGDVVGYSVRLDSRRSAHTRLLFCTTGCRTNPAVLLHSVRSLCSQNGVFRSQRAGHSRLKSVGLTGMKVLKPCQICWRRRYIRGLQAFSPLDSCARCGAAEAAE